VTQLGEWLAERLNQIFPPLAIHQSLQVAKSSLEANQRWAAEEAVRIWPAFQPYGDFAGLNVLDIGSGLGGKIPFYVLGAGARRVVSIDLDERSIQIAWTYLSSLKMLTDDARVIRLSVADAAAMPFPDNHFDAIVSINVFEHVARLEAAIGECYRVLNPGGKTLLHLPPYYSPWGPHLENWIHFPWPHLLFSEATLMRVAAKEDARLRLNRQFVDAAQIDWAASGDQIPNVNRVTLRRFRRLLQQAGFSILQLELLPVGYDYLESRGGLKALAFHVLKVVSHVPFMQEVVVTKMVYVLAKAV